MCIISKINIFSNKKNFLYVHKNYENKKYQKITNLTLKYKEYYFLGKYNFMSKIFPKIYLKFYYNITSHLTTKLMKMYSYFITIHFISNNKNYNSYYNPPSMYQT